MAGWLDALVNFGTKNADWLAPVAGAAAGALSGGKSQTTTQNSAPVLPENVKSGYDKLISDAMTAYGRPFDARPTKRVETGGNAFQQLFQNPELQMIQQQADAAYQQPQMMPQAQPEQPMTAQPDMMAMQEAALRGSVQPRWMGVNKGQLNPEMIDYMKSKDGSVNPYGAGTVNYADWLAGQTGMMNSGAGGIFKQANPVYQSGFSQAAPNEYAATYDPTSSWIDRLLPTLALAGMTAGIGAGAGAIAGPTMAGGIAPSTAATGFKGLTSLATGAR